MGEGEGLDLYPQTSETHNHIHIPRDHGLPLQQKFIGKLKEGETFSRYLGKINRGNNKPTISLVLSLASLTKDKYKLKPLSVLSALAFRESSFFSVIKAFPTVDLVRVTPSGQRVIVRSCPRRQTVLLHSCSHLTPHLGCTSSAGPRHLPSLPTRPLLLFCFGPPYSSLALHIFPSLPHRTSLSIRPPSPTIGPTSPPFLNYIRRLTSA